MEKQNFLRGCFHFGLYNWGFLIIILGFSIESGIAILVGIFLLGAAIYWTVQNRKPHLESKKEALKCPRCKKENALTLNILKRETNQESRVRSTSRNDHTIYVWSTLATMKEECKYCSYQSEQFSRHYENTSWYASDGTEDGVSGFTSNREIKRDWYNKK